MLGLEQMLYTFLYLLLDQQVDYYLMDPKFGRSNVSVELLLNDSWRSQTVEHDLLVYAITSLSQVEILRENRTSFQLVVPYNTPVDVSIAVSLCGQQSTSTIIQLSYSMFKFKLYLLSVNNCDALIACMVVLTTSLLSYPSHSFLQLTVDIHLKMKIQ